MTSHLILDFSPRVFTRQKTHSYLLLREKNGKGQFLNMENGSIEVSNVTKDEDGNFYIYLPSDGQSNKAFIGYPLVPYSNQDFIKHLKTYWNSTLSRSDLADREMRMILGMKPSEVKLKQGSSCSLADICIELTIETVEARKLLRARGIEKPGARWEWEDPDQIEKIRELLREIQPE